MMQTKFQPPSLFATESQIETVCEHGEHEKIQQSYLAQGELLDKEVKQQTAPEIPLRIAPALTYSSHAVPDNATVLVSTPPQETDNQVHRLRLGSLTGN
jgi:hypothetical protein